MKLLVVLCVFLIVACATAARIPEVIYDGPTYELTPMKNSIVGSYDEVANEIGAIADSYDEMAHEIGAIGDSTELPPIRERRVTCDVLSWTSKWFSFNHSACAVRCLIQGRRGGRCLDGVCICRY